MKKNLDGFYVLDKDKLKYTKNRKDYYFRCLIEFFVRYTYLSPRDLIKELEEQYDESKKEDQIFFIGGREFRIKLEKH